MTGLEQFLTFFGEITVAKIVGFGLAVFFCWKIYIQIQTFFDNKRKVLIEKHEAEKEKDEQLKTVIAEVNKYPQYREQSKKIQKELRDEIDILKTSQEKLAIAQEDMCCVLKEMQERQERRDRNKLRDRLLQSYRYYTDKEKNPSQSWTEMEAEAFWELFRDYEETGGNGYMHSTVQPAMIQLKIIKN